MKLKMKFRFMLLPLRMTRLQWPVTFIGILLIILISIVYLIASLLYPYRGIVAFNERLCAPAKVGKFPKIVHRIWDQKEVPERYVSYLQGCKQLNPDYEVRIWNATAIEDFLKSHYSWGLKLYLLYPHTVNRYDAARYFIIHHFGGIYLDMDMNCSKDFNTIFSSTPENCDVILGEAFPVGVVSNFMIAKPETQFFDQVIHNLINMKDETFVLSLYETFLKTGPIFLWKNYFNFPCKDHIKVVKKFKIRGEWLTHDGAATWQNRSGFFIMVMSNTWAAFYYVFNYLVVLAVVIFIFYLYIKFFCKKTNYQKINA